MATYEKLALALCLVLYAHQVSASLPHIDPEVLHARLSFKEWEEVMKASDDQEPEPPTENKDINNNKEPVAPVEGKPSENAEAAPNDKSDQPQPPAASGTKEGDEKRRMSRMFPSLTGKDNRAQMSLSQYLRLSPYVKRAMQTNRQPLRFG